MGLTAREIEILVIVERVSSCISVTATLMLLTTFFFIKGYRTSSNTLIFYASLANLFASVAVLIGESALSNPDGAFCQFQAFLLEAFMQSDPYWSCAMAVNVYLVFFRRYHPVRLKKLYWIYGVICYGIPFSLAIFCLFYRDNVRGKMYGDATLWCWIAGDWAAVRIYSYYMPVWISIVIALLIYLRVGIEIYRVRAQIRAIETSCSEGMLNTHNSVSLTSGTFISTADNNYEERSPVALSTTRTLDMEIESGCARRVPSAESSNMKNNESYPREGRFGNQSKDGDDFTSISPPNPPYYPQHPQHSHLEPVRRGFNILPPDDNYDQQNQQNQQYQQRRYRRASYSPHQTTMNKVKWAYTKCALLFTVSILITWVPATINRVYGLIYPDKPSFALNVCSALVLPLQGFWNTIIYFTTSLSVTRKVVVEWRMKRAEEREKREKTPAAAAASREMVEEERGRNGDPSERWQDAGARVIRHDDDDDDDDDDNDDDGDEENDDDLAGNFSTKTSDCPLAEHIP